MKKPPTPTTLRGALIGLFMAIATLALMNFITLCALQLLGFPVEVTLQSFIAISWLIFMFFRRSR